MRSDKGKAFVLRSQGKSYNQIASELKVSKGTLSNWFRGVDFSDAIKNELTKQAHRKNRAHLQALHQVRGIALGVQYEKARQEAEKDMKRYRNLPLFAAGLGLYWAAGDKTSKHYLRLGGADSKRLRVWLAFLQHICGISLDKVGLTLYLTADLDEGRAKRYWKKQLGVSKFNKTQWFQGQTTSQPAPYGTCTIITTSSYTKVKLSFWIDQLPEMVLNTVPRK